MAILCQNLFILHWSLMSQHFVYWLLNGVDLLSTLEILSTTTSFQILSILLLIIHPII